MSKDNSFEIEVIDLLADDIKVFLSGGTSLYDWTEIVNKFKKELAINYFEINGGNMLLAKGDIVAYGGSKHGQVLKKVERDDWALQNICEEYKVLVVQDYIDQKGFKIKTIAVFAVPLDYEFEVGSENYEAIESKASSLFAEINKSLSED